MSQLTRKEVLAKMQTTGSSTLLQGLCRKMKQGEPTRLLGACCCLEKSADHGRVIETLIDALDGQ